LGARLSFPAESDAIADGSVGELEKVGGQAPCARNRGDHRRKTLSGSLFKGLRMEKSGAMVHKGWVDRGSGPEGSGAPSRLRW